MDDRRDALFRRVWLDSAHGVGMVCSLVCAVPALRPLFEKHYVDQGSAVLPGVLLAEVARQTSSPGSSFAGAFDEVTAWLSDRVVADPGLAGFVGLEFVENLVDDGTGLLDRLPPVLKDLA